MNDNKNENGATNGDVLATCPCGAEFDAGSAVAERPSETPGETGVQEVGVVCPQCGAWTHAFFETAKVRRFRAALDRGKTLFQKQRTERNLKHLRRAQRKFREVFDTEQSRLRPLLGVQSPVAALGQTVTDVPKEGEE